MKSSRSPHRLVSDPAYPRLKDHLIRATGLAYYADKDADLMGRIAQRLAQLELPDCATYLALLQNGEEGEPELDELITELTIGETFFFRHRELFDALQETVIPDVLSRNRPSRQLRIWSAGCATGAEPYSVSLLLKRDFAEQLAGWDVTIVGTDINREFLARAREGRFEEWAFRTTPGELKQECFSRSEKTWLIKPEYKDGVSFQYHNLVTHPFPSLLNNLFAFDVILCRNVTIYFNAEIIHRIVEHFHQCLVEGGWLLVGHSEPNIELFRAFRTVNVPGAVLYQKNAEQQEIAALKPFSPVPSFWEPPQPEAIDQSFVPTWNPPSFPGSGSEWSVSAPAPRNDATAPLPPVVVPSVVAQPTTSELETIRRLADRGEWEPAAECCQKALEHDKLNPTIHFYQALVWEQMGRHAETEQALKRTIYLDRNFILAHYYMGLLLQKQRQISQAIRSFNNVLQLLSRIGEAHVFVDGDGITAGELKKLTQMNLDVLK